MEAATPKCPKILATYKLGKRVEVRCGRPLAYDAEHNLWTCAVPGHENVRGEDLAAWATGAVRFDDDGEASAA
jgi:hypothetical protein